MVDSNGPAAIICNHLHRKRTFLNDRRREQAAARHAAFLEFKRQVAERHLVERRAAAEALGVDLRTLRRWHNENKGPPRLSFGRTKVFYAMADIAQHLENKRNKVDRARATTIRLDAEF